MGKVSNDDTKNCNVILENLNKFVGQTVNRFPLEREIWGLIPGQSNCM